MIGEKFNKWTIVELHGKDKWGSLLYKCRCECSKEGLVRLTDLKTNTSIQCRDCGYKYKRFVPRLKSLLAGKGNNFRHGYTKSLIYGVWTGMIKRCKDTKGKDYKWYGSRGIKVCDRWLKFENFLEDMGIRPAGKVYIDRIDNDLGYFKENCRWVDAKINSQNRRTVKSRGFS